MHHVGLYMAKEEKLSGDGIVKLGSANPREKETPETRIHGGTAETNSASSPTT
ncbi:hypothetical protein Bca4012_026353 [Brassica carinata]